MSLLSVLVVVSYLLCYYIRILKAVVKAKAILKASDNCFSDLIGTKVRLCHCAYMLVYVILGD